MTRLDTLKRICESVGVEISSTTLDRLDRFRGLLLEYNQHTNLTAIRDPHDVEVKLLADSLLLLPLIDAELLREGRQSMRLIDIGTGAGFPGLPIAIARDDIEVTLVDATRKKVAFIEHVASSLGLNNAVPIHARSEELAHQQSHRERYDIVTARAVASMPALIELCLPFVRVGGLALLTKGRDISEEVDSAGKALNTLGGDLFDIWLPELDEFQNTSIVQVRKFKPTPEKFPRSPGTPANAPLLP